MGLSVTFPNIFRNEQKSISKQDLFDYEEWNIEIRKTNKQKQIKKELFQPLDSAIMNTFRKSRVHSNDLLFFIFSSPLITFLPESILIQKGKKLLIGLSPNNEIVKVELPRIKNAQTPPVGIDKSFLQTNQKKWDLTIREQTNCTAAFSTLNPLVVILFEVSWDKSWTVTSPYLADPSLGQYCG